MESSGPVITPRRLIACLSAFALSLIGVAGFGATSASAAPVTQNFGTGSSSWTVPAGVTSATFRVCGAQGASTTNIPGDIAQGTGGTSICFNSTMPVTPGNVYQVNVCAQGGGAPGGLAINGGANGAAGGGATDVRLGTTLQDRIIVAGGGGGQGGNSTLRSGGGGGIVLNSFTGDAVRGQVGFLGGTTDNLFQPTGGLAATSTTPGSGGDGTNGGTSTNGVDGSAGTLGHGGAGASASALQVTTPQPGGGGGGDGVYGGGGGAISRDWSGAGGGGGSSMVPAGSSFDSTPHTGDGSAAISYEQPPVAQNDSYTTNENVALTVPAPGVLGNDSGVAGTNLTAVNASSPAHGTVTLNADGSFTYTPAANFSGTDSFTYQASDGTSTSNTATVTLTVNKVFQPPVAANDGPYGVSEDLTLTVPAPGVLGNDTDPNGLGLSAALVTGPAHGTVTLNSDGSFAYTPAPNYNGPDSFTYHASDGVLTSNTAVVTLNVTNGPPANCTITGTPGNDVLIGTPGNDVICGLGGNDTIIGNGGNDILVGGPGNDTLIGGPGNDILVGGPGNDNLNGAGGNDQLFGGTGNDYLNGGPGVNVNNGGAGNNDCVNPSVGIGCQPPS